MNQKNIVITGGNRGIGNGLLKIFAKEHNVVLGGGRAYRISPLHQRGHWNLAVGPRLGDDP